MKETTPTAMPPYFEKWCKQFDGCWKNLPQKTGFRHYLGGLLGESERKNISQMANHSIGVVYIGYIISSHILLGSQLKSINVA
jgi:hypothetical protein